MPLFLLFEQNPSQSLLRMTLMHCYSLHPPFIQLSRFFRHNFHTLFSVNAFALTCCSWQQWDLVTFRERLRPAMCASVLFCWLREEIDEWIINIERDRQPLFRLNPVVMYGVKTRVDTETVDDGKAAHGSVWSSRLGSGRPTKEQANNVQCQRFTLICHIGRLSSIKWVLRPPVRITGIFFKHFCHCVTS